MLDVGMEGRPFRFVQVLRPSRIWLTYSFLDGKTLLEREPSAITASSGGSKECNREPDRTQGSSEELRAADL